MELALELGGALGTSSGGRIQILAGLAPAVEFVTLAHEYAHLCSAAGYVRSGPRGPALRRAIGRPSRAMLDIYFFRFCAASLSFTRWEATLRIFLMSSKPVLDRLL
jgi:hypothetical protein